MIKHFKHHYLLGLSLVGVLVLCVLSAALALRHELPEPVAKLELSALRLPELKVGDVIVRQGVSVDSTIIEQFSASIYSHVGMVAQVEPEITVIHATTADDAGAPHEGVVEVPLSAFVHESTAIAIVRFPLPAKALAPIQTYLRSKLGTAFRLDASAERNYCSTLVATALEPHLRLELKPIYLSLPLLAGDYLFPQAFVDEPHGRIIFRYPGAKTASH